MKTADHPGTRLKRLWIILGIAVILVFVLVVAGKSRRVETLAVEGVVRDARTKEPIRDVVINVGWVGHKYIGFTDTSFGSYHHETLVSDSAGRYTIPAVKLRIWRHQDVTEQNFTFYHPFYVRKFWNWLFRSTMSEDPDYYPTIRTKYAQNGVIHYDVELTHVRDRFKGPEDFHEFGAFLSGERPKYWRELEQRFGIKIDPLEVLREFEAINRKISPEREAKSLSELRAEVGKMMKEGY